jgi:hypothetical protein
VNLSDPQYRFLESSADWVIYGGAAGAGKTHILSLDPLRHCQGPHANPEFRGAIFRRTYPMLTKPGALLDHCKAMYAKFKGRWNWTRSEFSFPSEAKLALNTCQYESNLIDYMGAQFDWIGFDEITQFPAKFVKTLWGRCRSKSGVRPVLRGTCNPDADSWLAPFLSWWINQSTGFPIPERSGIVRHFQFEDEERAVWFDEPQFGSNGRCLTNSCTFIGATLSDNTHLEESDPDYRNRLEQLSPSERERYLNGCWLASSQTGMEWPRELFLDITISPDEYPTAATPRSFRSFSLDGSKGGKRGKQRKGDFSAIVCTTQHNDLKYVHASMDRRPPSQIVEDLFRFCQDPLHTITKGDLIGVESLQFQSLFIDLIMAYAEKHSDMALSYYLRTHGCIIPVEDTLPKELRIRRLDPFIRAQQFRFVDDYETNLLLNQLKTWDGIPGVGKYDDGPDALDMSLQMPGHLLAYQKKMAEGG